MEESLRGRDERGCSRTSQRKVTLESKSYDLKVKIIPCIFLFAVRVVKIVIKNDLGNDNSFDFDENNKNNILNNLFFIFCSF